jgi:hypothetical protein
LPGALPALALFPLFELKEWQETSEEKPENACSENLDRSILRDLCSFSMKNYCRRSRAVMAS